jgi:hypothetical protein
MKTEFELTLPRGYLDPDGSLHRDGVMRLATARDEVEPLDDPRTGANPAYASIALVGRVLVRLGPLSPVPAAVVQALFASDFAYLQEMYLRLNEGTHHVETECPSCGTRFAIDLLAETEAA